MIGYSTNITGSGFLHMENTMWFLIVWKFSITLSSHRKDAVLYIIKGKYLYKLILFLKKVAILNIMYIMINTLSEILSEQKKL